MNIVQHVFVLRSIVDVYLNKLSKNIEDIKGNKKA